MRFALAVLSLVLSTVSARTLWTDLRDNTGYNYDDWKMEFAEVAPTHTAEAFTANLATIRAHNAKHSTFKYGVNKFTGMSKADFKAYIGRGYAKGMRSHELRNVHHSADLLNHLPVSELPASKDWRTENAVTAVKDQGGCGGCWSFSTAETVESAVAIATGKLLVLSEEEILACAPNPKKCGGTGGCSGATQEIGFAFVADKGLTTETAWPYDGTSGTCDYTNRPPAVKTTGFVALPFNNYTALMNAIAQQPIAISAAAGAWQMYESGVLNEQGGCDSDVDHAIQLTGYGTDAASSLDYYNVRNSWGPSWGEGGYIRIQRFGEGKEPCATDNTPLDGDGCEGGPTSIKVCGLCGLLSDSSYPTGASLA